MKRAFLAVVLSLLALPSDSLGITRSALITEANSYKNHAWTCRRENLQDPGNDGEDDRTGWPYEMDHSYTGEAYAWNGWKDGVGWGGDTLTRFADRIGKTTEKWIAGAAPADVNKLFPKDTPDRPGAEDAPLPAGYKGYTGLDCSGFISRMWHSENWAIPPWNWHLGTRQLESYSTEILVEDLQPGDILLKPGSHVALFKEWVTPGQVARIIHASQHDWDTGATVVWRTNEDRATVAGALQPNTLPARKSEDGYTPRRANTETQIESPAQGERTNPTPRIRGSITSATPIIPSSITMKFESATRSITIPNSALTITSITGDTELSAEYQVTASDGLADGPTELSIYARNELDLEETETLTFVVDAVAPENPSAPTVQGGDGEAAVAWVRPTLNAEDLAGYRVYWSKAAKKDGASSSVLLPTSQLTYEIDSLLNDETHYYVAVTAVDSVGNESVPLTTGEHPDWTEVWPTRAVWVHQSGGPGDPKRTISDALTAALTGNIKTVMVGPGEYSEPILAIGEGSETSWTPSNIRVISERGPAETRIFTDQIEVGDKCEIIGFTLAGSTGSSSAIRIYFDEGVLIANNIFLGNETAIFSGGSLSGSGSERVNRIYNNTFVANTVGIQFWSSYAAADVRNNIFKGIGIGQKPVTFDAVCGNAFLSNNNFHGFRSADVPTSNDCAVVDDSSYCAPDFENFYHLRKGSSCGRDAGAEWLWFEDRLWDDCIAFGGNGRRADLGAYGGPFAYVDKNENGIPDCSESAANSSAVAVLMNSGGLPITLSARNGGTQPLAYSIVAPPEHGSLEGAAPELTYTPSPGYSGQDELSFTVSDDNLESQPAKVDIRVKESNTPPTVLGQDLSTGYRKAAVVMLQSADVDGDPLTYPVTVEPRSGAFLCLTPPKCLYVPEKETHGEVSFSFKANDGFSESAPATVNVLVNSEPTFSFLKPDAPEIVTRDWHLNLEWQVVDEDSAATVSLYYDNDATGYDGIPIVLDLPENELQPFSWNISALVEGTSYHVYAVVEDEWSTVRAYAPTSIVVDRTGPTVSVSPSPGLYNFRPLIKFNSEPGAKIHCTTDDSTPSAESPRCDEGVTLDRPLLPLEWIAFDGAGNPSLVGRAVYELDEVAPEVTPFPSGKRYPSEQVVTLHPSEDDVVIHCTVDGSIPTTASPLCQDPIPVNDSLVLQWLAVDPAGNQSDGSAAYVIDRIAPVVVALPPGGLYNSPQEVRFKVAEPVEPVILHCTFDGPIPTSSSPICVEPIQIYGSCPLRLRWLAVDLAGNESIPGEETYCIDQAPPEMQLWPLPVRQKQCLEFQLTGGVERDATFSLTSSRPLEIGPIVRIDHDYWSEWSATIRNAEPGAVVFTATATDPAGNTASIQTSTEIYNEPPVINSSYPKAGTVELSADGSALFWVEASDPDDPGALSYSWFLGGMETGSGDSLTFNPGEPLADGIARTLRVEVSDGFATTARTWEVTVRAVEVLDDEACTKTAGWSQTTSGSGYFGIGYLKSSGNGQVVCRFDELAAGTYKVYARWPASGANDADAVVQVTYAGGEIDEHTVDQTANGGRWNLVGTYLFDGTATVRVLSVAGEQAVADAFRLVATGDPPDIIVDDASGQANGTWSSGSGGFRGGYRYRTAIPSTESMTFKWDLGLNIPGTWDLHARWQSITGGASNAKYILSFDEERETQITVDQKVLGGRWNQLGTFSFESADTPSVAISDNANGTVVADGVKLVYRDAGNASIVDNDGDSDLEPNANGSADLFGWGEEGDWPASSGVTGFIGSNYRRINGGDDGGWAKWLLYLPQAGNYELYARWTAATDRSSSVRYEFWRKGVPSAAVAVVNQKVSGGEWHYLGRYACQQDDTADDPTLHETYLKVWQSADGVVVADAILAVRTDEDAPLIVDNSGTGGFQSGGWALPSVLVPGHWGADYI